jgi:hypothetical protein
MSKPTSPEPGWERTAPRVVVQRSRFACWAAALEAWIAVTPKSPASWFLKTQDDALATYKVFLAGERKALTVSAGKGGVGGLEMMAAGVGMGLKVFKKASLITGAFLYQKLLAKGHVYLMYADGTVGHTVVIYKIVHPFNSKKCMLSVMDPWPEMGLIERPLTEVQANAEAIVGWPE